MEPEWTKAISSRTVCDFYYILFIIRAVVLALLIGAFVYTLAVARKSVSPMTGPILFTQVGAILILLLDTLFNYLICERALKPGAPEIKKTE